MLCSPDAPLYHLLAGAGLTIPSPLPSAKERAISIEMLRRLLDYDPETGLLKWKYRPDAKTEWNTKYAGVIAGTKRKGIIQVRIPNGNNAPFLVAHRIVWAMHYGEWPSHLVDHEDGDQANNRIGNLRPANSSENNCNRHVIAGKLPFKGVYFNAARGKFAAQIKKNKAWHWVGLFLTAEDAARAYDIKALELHGEFAKTNKMLGLL